jgi:hypothetical protein
MWGKVVVWSIARPADETCKTNPILGERLAASVRAGQTCKTNPISPRRRRLTEEIVRNEAKLEGTGVCGQRQLARGTRLARGVKRAKRTQFAPPQACGGRNRAKQTQSGPRAREWALAGGPRCPAGVGLCKTNPIWPRPGRAPEAKCAKRTQFGVGGPGLQTGVPGQSPQGLKPVRPPGFPRSRE